MFPCDGCHLNHEEVILDAQLLNHVYGSSSFQEFHQRHTVPPERLERAVVSVRDITNPPFEHICVGRMRSCKWEMVYQENRVVSVSSGLRGLRKRVREPPSGLDE
jgi:hypothetical protein